MLSYKIIAFACIFGIMIAEVLPFVANIKRVFKLKRVKPFDCSLCLSMWSALGLSLWKGEDIFSLLFNFFCAGFLIFVYERWIK